MTHDPLLGTGLIVSRGVTCIFFMSYMSLLCCRKPVIYVFCPVLLPRVHLCLNAAAVTVTRAPPTAPPTSRCPLSALEFRFCSLSSSHSPALFLLLLLWLSLPCHLFTLLIFLLRFPIFTVIHLFFPPCTFLVDTSNRSQL